MKKDQPNRFVLLKSEFTNDVIKLSSMKKINIDVDSSDNVITCISVYINDEHWEAFDGEDVPLRLERELQTEILKEFSTKLNEGCNDIDMESLIRDCANNVKVRNEK